MEDLRERVDDLETLTKEFILDAMRGMSQSSEISSGFLIKRKEQLKLRIQVLGQAFELSRVSRGSRVGGEKKDDARAAVVLARTMHIGVGCRGGLNPERLALQAVEKAFNLS